MTLEDELRVEIVDTLRKRKKDDIRDIIEYVMATPLKTGGNMMQANGTTSFSQLMSEGANMDTATRIILAQTARAMNGDVKSAEFLFKYGGYTPVVDQRITLELPQIIDDVSVDRTRDILTSSVSKDTILIPPASEPALEPPKEDAPKASAPKKKRKTVKDDA